MSLCQNKFLYLQNHDISLKKLLSALCTLKLTYYEIKEHTTHADAARNVNVV